MVRLTWEILRTLSAHKFDKKLKPIVKSLLENNIDTTRMIDLGWFSSEVLKKRWPEAEARILTNAMAARQYAQYTIKGRWKEAESILITDPGQSYLYAVDTLKGRFHYGERVIAGDEFSSYRYGRHVWGYEDTPYRWVYEVPGLEGFTALIH